MKICLLEKRGKNHLSFLEEGDFVRWARLQLEHQVFFCVASSLDNGYMPVSVCLSLRISVCLGLPVWCLWLGDCTLVAVCTWAWAPHSHVNCSFVGILVPGAQHMPFKENSLQKKGEPCPYSNDSRLSVSSGSRLSVCRSLCFGFCSSPCEVSGWIRMNG